MKKKLSVMLIMAMAFVCMFMLTACDPEIIEKLPGQILTEVFAQLETDNYVLTMESVMGEGEYIVNETIEQKHDGTKFSYETFVYEQNKRYFELDANSGKAYSYDLEPDYGYIKSEISMDEYNSFKDLLKIEKNGIFNADKYELKSESDGFFGYVLKDEYKTEEYLSVKIVLNDDGGFTMQAQCYMESMPVEVDARFHSFDSVSIEFPEAEVPKTADDYKALFNEFLALYGENNCIVEVDYGVENEHLIITMDEDDDYSYISMMKRRTVHYVNPDGTKTQSYHYKGDILAFGKNTYDCMLYFMFEEDDFLYGSKEISIEEAGAIMNRNYISYFIMAFLQEDNFEYFSGGTFNMTEEAMDSISVLLDKVTEFSITVDEDKNGNLYANAFVTIVSDDGTEASFSAYFYGFGAANVEINRNDTIEVGG